MRGLRIALTGGLEGVSRAIFKGMLTEVGAVFSPNLDAHTDLLVVGKAPLPSKVADAERLRVRTLPAAEFMHQLLEHESTAPLANPNACVPCLALSEKSVRVLDLVLPRRARGPLTPDVDHFRSYTLDRPTLALLRSLARAVLLAHPCLITGNTATAKSSAIHYLASLVGAQVVRLNLNGQTETGELIGRYVPDGAGWRFAEGLLPQAMRNGWWLILDEVNLAEPAVIERLNPALERNPTLVLTEGPGTRFGAGGVPVHPDFRVFATQNPPRYVGRSALSAAWRDRFVAQVVADDPGEAEFLQLLHHLTSGEQPTVEINGVTWSPAPSWGTPHTELESLAERWPQVASFFAGLMAMTRGTNALGAERREPPVFSRRGLLAVVDALLKLERIDPVRGRLDLKTAPREMLAEALRAATVARLFDAPDRQRVEDLLASLDL